MNCKVFSVGIDSDTLSQLEERGIVSVNTDSGGLSLLASANPDAVILTRKMDPAISKALTEHDGLKAILLAPDAQEGLLQDALREHWFGYFSSPFDIEEVAAAVNEAQAIESWSDGIEVISSRANWLSLQVRCRRYTAERLVRFMGELVADVSAADREHMGLAFREIVLNGMEHGAAFDGSKYLCVSCLRTSRFIMYTVRDPGTGFNFNRLPHAAISNPDSNPAQHMLYRAQQGIRAGGFGLMVARDVVDEMLHNEQGNEVVLIKYLESTPGTDSGDAKGPLDAA